MGHLLSCRLHVAHQSLRSKYEQKLRGIKSVDDPKRLGRTLLTSSGGVLETRGLIEHGRKLKRPAGQFSEAMIRLHVLGLHSPSPEPCGTGTAFEITWVVRVRKLVKGHHVLIVGHADADGHLAAEQSRCNVLRMGACRCEVLVDPKRTASYRMWHNHLPEIPIARADTVIFVDIMFPPDDPSDSVWNLIELANKNPGKSFVVIDHHPVLGLPELPQNLGIWFTSAVYTCCFGLPTWLMVVAAICDRDEGPVAPMIDNTMRLRALGMERAVADRDLAGEKLLRLLAADRWDLLETLAKDSNDMHKRVRGRRLRQQPLSVGLAQAHAAIGL